MIRMWKHLRREKARETKAEQDLRKKYQAFLSVLLENEHSLDLMTRLEEKLYTNQLISLPYLKAMIGNLSKRIAHTVESLIQLSGGEYVILRDIYSSLDRDIRQVLVGRKDMPCTQLIISLHAVTKELADKVGNKMANLGDMGNCCGQLVPAGFASTACAYTYFMEYNDLPAKIQEVLCRLEPNNNQQLLWAEKTIRNLFLQAEMPPEIERSILEESAKLERERGRPLYWAVRSSAIGEDLAESSFAGQFATVLNVRTDQLLETYKEVAASKYNARVIVYQRLRNIRDDEVAMSVGFIEMIDPVCSGTMYSLNPVMPNRGEIVINAVWGIGELLVEGVISADVYVLKRDPGFPLLHEETADKEMCLSRAPGGGLRQVVVSKVKSGRSCLNGSQLKRLAGMAMRIEEHFQGPQDIEWCFDQQENLYMLQARPLRICAKKERKRPVPAIDAEIIAEGTQPISPGVGWGKVLKAAEVHDIPDNLSPGTVLVLKHSSPRFVGALRKVAAVVVEKGNWTDHMASVIREFGVPCLVRVSDIFKRLQNGQEITVDADEGIIYAGVVPGLHKEIATVQKNNVNMPVTESHRMLADMADSIFPLHLTDPREENFTPESCRSWHDLLRFCHETALNEMFLLKEKHRLQSVKNIFRVETDLPFTLYLLDITGTTISGEQPGAIRAEAVKSLPFQKLWEGMTDPALNWQGPKRDIRSEDLYSAMLRAPAMSDTPADTVSYAVVAPEYLNLSLSMGYHYIVLDCYLSDDAFNNYISLSFKGGAAEPRKRGLRVAFVAKVLRHMDFNVTTANDYLKARLKAESAQEFGLKLGGLGHVFGVTRLLDLALDDESMVAQCVARFEAHDYSLGMSGQY